jgi:hypothetical protein
VKLILGPILYAESQTDPETWSFSVNLLLAGFDAISPTVEWRMDDVKDVLVPARGALPRCAFFSCNGMSHLKSWATLDRPFALWEEMLRQQQEDAGFHVLIGGGDQRASKAACRSCG